MRSTKCSDLNHVRAAEPVLQYPFEVRSQWRKKDTIVIGLPPDAQLQKLMDTKKRVVPIEERGLIVSKRLAQDLGVGVGDTVTLKPLMGRITREREVKIAKVVKQYLGTSAYMHIDTLSRLLSESFVMNAALLRVEPGQANALNVSLKDVPGVTSVEIKEELLPQPGEHASREHADHEHHPHCVRRRDRLFRDLQRDHRGPCRAPAGTGLTAGAGVHRPRGGPDRLLRELPARLLRPHPGHALRHGHASACGSSGSTTAICTGCPTISSRARSACPSR